MKHTFSKKVLLLSGGLFVLGAFQPDAAHAASFNLCKAADIPGSTLQRIRQRDDFADLLSQVVQVCPAQALILTDGPTASISGASADDGNGFSEGGETASPADDVDVEPDGGGAPGGGGNDAPDDEDDGGGGKESLLTLFSSPRFPAPDAAAADDSELRWAANPAGIPVFASDFFGRGARAAAAAADADDGSDDEDRKCIWSDRKSTRLNSSH